MRKSEGRIIYVFDQCAQAEIGDGNQRRVITLPSNAYCKGSMLGKEISFSNEFEIRPESPARDMLVLVEIEENHPDRANRWCYLKKAPAGESVSEMPKQMAQAA